MSKVKSPKAEEGAQPQAWSSE